jgi:predicted nucleic acid-binding protein
VFRDEESEYAEKILEVMGSSSVVVPRVWPFEVINGLLVGERRGRVTISQCWRFLNMIKHLAIDVDARTTQGVTFEELLEIGRNQRLSGYDAAFIEVALRHHLPLATLDKDMQRAAGELGIDLLDPA